MAQIQNFHAIANTAATRVEVTGGGAVKNARGTFGGRALERLTPNSALHTQNRAAIDSFRAALSSEYGHAIGNQVFANNLAGLRNAGTDLSANDVQQAIAAADALRTQGVQANRQFGLQRLDHYVGAQLGNANSAAQNLGAQGAWKLQTRLDEALKLVPNISTGRPIVQGNIDLVAQSVVNQFFATGEAGLSRAQLALPNNVALQGAVNHALANINYPDAARAPMYREFLSEALASVAASVVAADQRPNCPLLTSLGSQLAEVLDEKVAHAVYSESQKQGNTNYAGLTGALTANAGAIQGFLAQNIGAFHGLENDIVAFSKNINETMQRVGNDIGGIDQTFFGGNGNVQNLTDIRITSSDPHHGGHRVLILEFNGGNKVVYKPRDCRIDAKLAGTANVGGNGQSAAGKINGYLGNANAIPTYAYMLQTDGPGNQNHYAYSQFLDHVANAPFTPQQQTDYYKTSGRLAAMAYLFGATDLHQGNLIVSGHQPYLTDLELSFSPSVLKLHDYNQAMVNRQDLRGMDGGFDNVGLFGAMGKTSESEYILPFSVNNGVIAPRINQEPKATLNRVNDQNGAAINGNWKAAHGADFLSGFNEVVTALGNGNNVADLQNFAGQFNGMHARFHPTETLAQLNRLETMKLESDKMPEEYLQRSAQNNEGLDPNRQAFIPSMVSDLVTGDVPYYTRAIGSDQVLHNGTTPVVTGNANNQYFLNNGLTAVQQQIGVLGSPNGRALVSQIAKNYVT